MQITPLRGPIKEAQNALEGRRTALRIRGELATVDERAEIDEIEAALLRIDSGAWGLCQSCGHAIGYQLLRASPTQRLCLWCDER